MEIKQLIIQLEVTNDIRNVFRSLMDINYKQQVDEGYITDQDRQNIIAFVNAMHSIIEH